MFYKRVDFYTVGPEPTEGLKVLPPGAYSVSHSEVLGWILTPKELAELPSKMYGNIHQQASRILTTFKDRQQRHRSTGVMLSGEKGSGKTLLSLMVIKELILTMPVLIIETPFAGPNFAELIAECSPCVVFFDEFEKIYDEDSQEGLLSLLDGATKQECLFLATLNREYEINDALRNRPSRFFYHFKFDGLSREFVSGYAMDMLSNPTKDMVVSLEVLHSMFYKMNFDMLQAIVEEMNRYGETAQEAVKPLNINDYLMRSEQYELTLTHIETGKKIKCSPNIVKQLPSQQPCQVSWHVSKAKAARLGLKVTRGYNYYGPENQTEINVDHGIWVYESNGMRLEVRRAKDLDWEFFEGGVRQSNRYREARLEEDDIEDDDDMSLDPELG